ncbi:MAG: DUF4412 domain-containing protein [Planctomycetes bacterium]|nr:DUF4412 domain-containing protein [Planctomycetota bacterium]
MKKLPMFAVAVLALACPRNAAASETIVLTQKVLHFLSDEDKPRKTSLQTLSIAPRRIRLDSPDGTYLLLDFDKGVLYEVDGLLQSYTERDIRNFEEKWRKANSMLLRQIEGVPEGHSRRAELIDRLSDGPAKWQMIWKMKDGEKKTELLRKYFLPPAPPKVTVEKTSEKKNIAGYDCVLYRVMEGDQVRSYAWIAPAVPLEKDLAEFLKVTGIIEENIAGELARIKGFPIEYGMYWRNGRVEKTVTTKASKKKTDRGVFDLPENFVKQKTRFGI